MRIWVRTLSGKQGVAAPLQVEGQHFSVDDSGRVAEVEDDLLIADSEFRMLQCGYFPGANISAVAVRGDTLVIAGSAKEHEDPKSQSPIRVYKPLQRSFGGGIRDGYFAVFKIEGK